MIWSFIGGFITGAIVCFVVLVVIACFSIKSKQAKLSNSLLNVQNGTVKLTPADVEFINKIEKELQK